MVETWICGGVMLGYWAMGNEIIATRPAMVMTMEITAEKIGRSIKNFENMLTQSRPVTERQRRQVPVGSWAPVPARSGCLGPAVLLWVPGAGPPLVGPRAWVLASGPALG